MQKVLVFIILFLFQSLLYSENDPVMKQGEMRINFMPELILIGNTPVPGWKVYNDNMDKVFEKDVTAERKFRFTNGEYLFFDWWFMPINRLKINIG